MADYARASGAAPEVPGFDVGRCLGRGGSASVWLVTERQTGREYALKCFPAGGSRDRGEAEEAVRREVRILSVLDHEHLVRARSVMRLLGGEPSRSGGDDGDGGGANRGGADWRGTVGLIMDYAAGGSLGQLVAGRGELGPGETVTVLTPIAQALAYLHSQGFTHGDVSPGNVLFTPHGKPLLADLGVARMVADATAVADAGTEGFRDPAPVDAVRAGLQPERDVYSLAALGWYCLTGRAPEPGAQRPPLPLLVPGVPAELAAALESGLHEDRRLRPSAAELAAAVHRSAVAAPVDLSVSVHPTVIPQLLTRRSLPATARERRVERVRAFGRRFHKPRAPWPPPPERSTRTGTPSRNAGARHSTRRNPSRRRVLRSAAVALAVLGFLAAGWGLAGAPVPPAFPGFAVMDADAAKKPGPDGTDGPDAPDAPDAPDPVAEPGTRSAPGPEQPGMGAAAVPPEVQAQLDSQNPEEAVRGLARLRSLAFSTGDLRLLDRVNVPASSAAAADGHVGASLSASGRVLAGFTTVLTEVEATGDSDGPLAVVAVVVSTSAYQERDAAGAVAAETAATPEQRLLLVLAPVEGRWRIRDILPGGAATDAGK